MEKLISIEQNGDVAMESRHYQKAIINFSEAIAVFPYKASIWNKRCSCLLVLKEYDLALDDALKAIELDDKLKSARHHLIECFLNLGNVENVEIAIKKLEELDSTIPLTDQTSKARKLRQLQFKIEKSINDDDYEQCLSHLDEALKLSPASTDYQFLKLRILVILERFENIDEKLGQPGMLNVLKQYYQGNVNESLRLLKTVQPTLRVSKEIENFREKLVNLVDGTAEAKKLADGKNFLNAARNLESFVEIDRSNKQLTKDLSFKVAEYNYQSDVNTLMALYWVNKVLEIDENFSGAILLKAQCLFNMKSYKNSSECIDLILKSEGNSELKKIATELKKKIEEAVLVNVEPEIKNGSTSSFSDIEMISDDESPKPVPSSQYSFTSKDMKQADDYDETSRVTLSQNQRKNIKKAERLFADGEYLQAIVMINSVVSTIDPSNKQLNKTLYFKIAQLYYESRINFSSAIRYSNMVLEIDGSFFEAVILKALCYMELKLSVNVRAECDIILQSKAPADIKKMASEIRAEVDGTKKLEAEVTLEDDSEDDSEDPPSKSRNVYEDDYVEKPEPEKFSTKKPSQSENIFEKDFDTKNKKNSNEKNSKPTLNKAEEMFELGSYDYQSKCYVSAIKYLTEAIALSPTETNYYNKRAACHFDIGEFELASVDSLKSIDLEPGNSEAYMRAVNCFLLLGNVNQAENYMEKFKVNVSGIDFSKNNEARMLKSLKRSDVIITNSYEAKDFEECLKNLDGALEIAQACVRYGDYKIESLIMLDATEEADKMINKVLEKDPQQAQMFFFKGLMFYRQGEFQASIDQFVKCLRIDPDMTKGQKFRTTAKEIDRLYRKGVTNFAEKEFLQAKEAFRAALKLDKSLNDGRNLINNRTKLLFLYNLGSAYFKLNNHEEALKIFTAVLTLDSSHIKSLTKRAKSNFELKQFDECLMDCGGIKSLQPSDVVDNLIKKTEAAIKAGEKKPSLGKRFKKIFTAV